MRSIVFQMNKLLQWLATGWIGGPAEVLSRIANRDRFAKHKLLGYPEQAFRLRGSSPCAAGPGEVPDRGTETLGGRSEHDEFSESATVVRIKDGDFRLADERNARTSGV